MKNFLILSLLLAFLTTEVCAQWKPAGDKIKTQWANKINTSAVLPEYPRPIMERNEWKNLNGLWEYAITDLGGNVPAHFDGQILVPFAVESSLSGVGQRVGAKKELWYSRSFEVPVAWKNKNVLLHFGAVDWKADIWVNDVKVGSHTGGFTPFSFDITAALSGKGNNRLVVKVWDPTDEGYQPRGKQVNNPEGIWYTPVTGIWQTVWLEPVTARHIEELRITPDIDQHLLTVKAHLNMRAPSDLIEVNVYDGNQLVATGKSINDEAVVIPMPEDAKLWSPDFPFLYTLKVMLKNDNKILDQVNSYAAMRKYSTKRDANGIVRLELNNQPLFQFGPLDQGWWPDGLYTAPSDEALEYDVKMVKEMGFNMIRKHVKVEPARWYYHCDKLGMLVWQDIPNATTNTQRNDWVETNFVREAHNIMNCLKNTPSIITWVAFNEGWGQYDRKDIEDKREAYTRMAVKKVQEKSNGRLVNAASGWFDYEIGDMIDKHHYPLPAVYDNPVNQRAVVCGEYGGINLKIDNHIWAGSEVNYTTVNSAEDLKRLFIEYAGKVEELKKQEGLCAAVYTQITDVESEINGLITYDRKVVKWSPDQLMEVRKVLEAIKNIK